MEEMDGNILTLEETKLWIREEDDDPQVLKQIKMLIDSAEGYLSKATGIEFDRTNGQAKLLCLVLIADWYENRQLSTDKVGEKVRFTVQSILAQLQYGYEKEGEET